MPIVKAELKDYYSSGANSDGGSIATTQIANTELSAAAAAGATSISVYDAGGFAVNDEIWIDDGTNKENRIITAISGTTFSLNIALSNSYAQDTPVAKKNNLFPDVTPEEASAGLTRYRKFFRKNANATLTWEDVKSWISKQPTNSAISIGLGLNDTNDADANQGNMVALSANAQIALVSSAADTRQVTLKGLNASGVLVVETITLNGTTEVLSTNTFSKLYLAYASALNASNTITLKQGSLGPTIGTIGANKICCWLWFGKKVSAGSIINAEGGDIPDEISGIKLGNIVAGGNQGFWVRMMVIAGSSPVSGNDIFIQIKGQTA